MRAGDIVEWSTWDAYPFFVLSAGKGIVLHLDSEREEGWVFPLSQSHRDVVRKEWGADEMPDDPIVQCCIQIDPSDSGLHGRLRLSQKGED